MWGQQEARFAFFRRGQCVASHALTLLEASMTRWLVHAGSVAVETPAVRLSFFCLLPGHFPTFLSRDVRVFGRVAAAAEGTATVGLPWLSPAKPSHAQPSRRVPPPFSPPLATEFGAAAACHINRVHCTNSHQHTV